MSKYSDYFFYDPNNQIDSDQFEKILRYIRSGVESGATLETGGDKLGNKGFYIQPTVFSNVKVYLFSFIFALYRMSLKNENTTPKEVFSIEFVTITRMAC